MFGAIFGDLAGSIYEFEQCSSTQLIDNVKLYKEDEFYSDDTILTIAVLEAFLKDKNYEKYLKKYAIEYENYVATKQKYFKTVFSPSFTKWAHGDYTGVSAGNGAMMRISAVGYLSNSEEEVIENARLATIPSHNCEESINAATLIALVIFYARKGKSKEEIINLLNIKLEYKEFSKFNMTCPDTTSNCMYALFTSNSFEEAIAKVISYGGDTDTNACIVGAMAEALYGINNKVIEWVKEKLPVDMVKLLDKGYKYTKKRVH